MLPQSDTLLLWLTATLEMREGKHNVCLGRVTSGVAGPTAGSVGSRGGFRVSLFNGQCVKKQISPYEHMGSLSCCSPQFQGWCSQDLIYNFCGIIYRVGKAPV